MHKDRFTVSNTNASAGIDVPAREIANRAAGIGVWSAHRNSGWIILTDDLTRELLGIEEEQSLEPTAALELFYKEDRELIKSMLVSGFYLQKTAFQYDVSCRTIADVTRWLRIKGTNICDASGTIQQLAGIVMDVTTEKQQHQLISSTVNLEKILPRGTGIGLFQIGLENNEINYSPAFSVILTGENKLGLSRETFIDHIHPEDREIRIKAYMNAANSGEVLYESRTVWTNRSIHWIRTVGSYSFDESGKPISFFGTVQDITEEKKTGTGA